MSKGPKIKDWVKWYVHSEAIKNRAEPRDSVAERVEQFLEDKEPVPSRDTLVKMISSARNSGDPEDRPWTVSSLGDYDIPPEVLPVLMEAWARALKLDTSLSIRQIKWIARLYYVLKDKSPESLLAMALRYAKNETVIRAAGKYPAKTEEAWWLWLQDAELYRIMTGDDSLYRKCSKHVSNGWVLLATTTITLQRSSNQKECPNERLHSQKR